MPDSRQLVARAAEAIHRRTCQADKPENCDGATRSDFDLAVAALSVTGPGGMRICAERGRQVDAEGYTPEHDAEHALGQLASAAVCYAQTPLSRHITALGTPRGWPWSYEDWKPGERIRELAKAGALIAAEIDRLLRQDGDTG